MLDSNLAVAYVSIDDEFAARNVGTTLWLEKSEQRELISAGFRQAHASLTGDCSKTIGILDIQVTCPGKPTQGISPGVEAATRGVIEFNTGLVKMRRTDLIQAKSKHLARLSTSILHLQTAINDRLMEQQYVDLLHQHQSATEEALDEFDVAKRKSARMASAKALQNGKALADISSYFARYYNHYEKSGTPGKPNAVAALLVACRTIRLYNAWGFSGTNAPLRRGSCDGVRPPLLSAQQDVRLVELQKETRKISSACNKILRTTGCGGLTQFLAQVDAAILAYSAEMKRKPVAEEVVGDIELDERNANCEILLTLSEGAGAIGAAANEDPPIDALGDGAEQIVAASENALRDVIAVPSSMKRITAQCRDLLLDKRRQASEAIVIALSDVSEAKRDSECILRFLKDSWPRDEGRVSTIASKIFESNDIEPICGHNITVIPSR